MVSSVSTLTDIRQRLPEMRQFRWKIPCAFILGLSGKTPAVSTLDNFHANLRKLVIDLPYPDCVPHRLQKRSHGINEQRSGSGLLFFSGA